MKNFFSYDSKLMQALMFVGDIMILNILFLICCVPVVTIGAAQAGLYTGVKVLLDKEDDNSCAKAFFRGFFAGFKKITLVWIIFLLIFVVLGYSAVTVYILQQSDPDAPFVFSIIALCFFGLFQSLTALFHFRFDCKWWRLITNSWYLFIAFPLRSLLVGVLNWAPLFLLLYDTYMFMNLTPLFMLVYFTISSMICFGITKKPFNLLMNKDKAPAEAAAEAPQEAEEETPALPE